MDKTLEQLITEFTHFSINTFEMATPWSSLIKLQEEIKEVMHELQHGHEDLAEEYADCLMCLFDSAARVGISTHQLTHAFQKKLRKNIKREWIRNDDNTYSHKK